MISDEHHNTCDKSHHFSYDNGRHCCATKASNCPDRCSDTLKWDFPENCCPEKERKECDYDACSDYSEGVDFKSSFPFIDFPILQGAVLNIMLPILIMTLTLSQ